MNLAGFNNTLTPAVAGIAFIALAFFVVVTFILDYHLRRFSMPSMRATVAFARIIYLGVSILAISMILLLTVSLFK